MRTCEMIYYCPHIQPIPLIFPLIAPTFRDSVSKIYTSKDLHCPIQKSASHNPLARINDLHQNIRTCNKPSRDLDHTIQTWIRLSGSASFFFNNFDQLKKHAYSIPDVKYTIDSSQEPGLSSQTPWRTLWRPLGDGVLLMKLETSKLIQSFLEICILHS